MRCSIAARRAPASRRYAAGACGCRARWGTSADAFDERHARQRLARSKSAIGHVRYSTASATAEARQRPAHSHRLCAWTDRPLPQRKPGERSWRCATGPRASRLHFSDQQRHRGDPAPLREVDQAPTAEDAHRRVGVASVRGAFSLVTLTHQGQPDRRSRSSRLSSAGAGPVWMSAYGRLLGDVCAWTSLARPTCATSNRVRSSSSDRSTGCKSFKPFPPAPLCALRV